MGALSQDTAVSTALMRNWLSQTRLFHEIGRTPDSTIKLVCTSDQGDITWIYSWLKSVDGSRFNWIGNASLEPFTSVAQGKGHSELINPAGNMEHRGLSGTPRVGLKDPMEGRARYGWTEALWHQYCCIQWHQAPSKRSLTDDRSYYTWLLAAGKVLARGNINNVISPRVQRDLLFVNIPQQFHGGMNAQVTIRGQEWGDSLNCSMQTIELLWLTLQTTSSLSRCS